MSLAHYRKKRSFDKTPEPEGRKQQNTGPLRRIEVSPLTFVIQRHHASQLHYDFRLELDGALKSWAVPKGPSLDPDDKRLAMMVEDHPMDYANFEGIIPKGNYGAGTVMVWDQGVYCPIDAVEREAAEKILRAQLAKGHLTFIMFGKKLKGEFALVRTPKTGENAWLLFKAGDEYVSKEDILEQDKSVVTGRSMDQIAKQAEKKHEVWFSTPKNLDLDDAPKGKMPHSVTPMLATLVEESFDRPDWLFELKWDGYRAIAEIERTPSRHPGTDPANSRTRDQDLTSVRLYSRNQQSYMEKFAPVAESLAKFPGSAVLDGEVVVVDSDGHPKFQWLQDYPKFPSPVIPDSVGYDRDVSHRESNKVPRLREDDNKRTGELRYYVFDILHLNGHNLTTLPLRRRKEILQQILPPLPHIFYSDHIEEHGTAFFEQAEKLGVEGIMAKNADSIYRPGIRTKDWLKIKTHQSQEAIIAGYTQGRGSRNHFGALVLGVYKDGKLTYIGHTGGGFDEQKLEAIRKKLKPLEQKTCPFEIEPQTNAPVTWVKPKIVCEVKFAGWTDDGVMRQPIFVGLRDDKQVDEVKVERVFSPTAPDESIDLTIKKHHVKVANPSKVFWPNEGYTKGDLIEYYRAVAPFLLPHLVDRPQSLKRYPNGIEGDNFYQKNVESLNLDWIKTVKIKSEDKTIEYLLCQDEATLVYLINLGCIDLNPWSSRTWYLDNPDYCVIDLDPEDISFAEVVKVAVEFRMLFEKIDLKAYIKTSGATGMHIYIPLGAKYTYEQARQFAQLLSTHVNTKLPETTSMVRSPKDRQGKVYLDCLQNARGQTLASVYSVRPLPEAPVATPLKWDELTSKLHTTQFTLKNTLTRIEKHGDLFMPTLGKGIVMKQVLKSVEQLIG